MAAIKSNNNQKNYMLASVKCALKSASRNISFKTVVLDKSDNKSPLSCETGGLSRSHQ